MARKSRYLDRIKVKGLDVALYVRLSEEDFYKKDESMSIKNQKSMLSNYLNNLENVESYKFYVDDGYSGGNFERPAFKTMIADIIEKKINCVIVKDFSRLGRDYLGVSNYYQVVFPTFNVRAISINDNYDSDINFDRLEDILSMDLKNVLNDEYLKDCSIKAKISYEQRQKRGMFTSPVTPYGYKKSDEDKHKLIIDEEVADNVRFIYQDYLEKQSLYAVARDISKKNILSPSAYKHTKPQSYYTFRKIKSDTVWSADTIKTILTNVFYIGNTAQHRRAIIDYKTKKCIKLPKEQWVVVENTHEPIIDKGTFEKVQNIINSRKDLFFSKNKQENPDNYFSGLIVCGKCDHNMIYMHDKNAKYTHYKCKLRSRSTELCDQDILKTQVITKIVLQTIKHLAAIACNMDEMIKEIECYENSLIKIQNSAINKAKSKKQILEAQIEALYISYRNGEINLPTYTKEKEILMNKFGQEKAISPQITPLKENEFIKNFKKYKTINSLNKELVKSLINKIIVYSADRIEIDFKFRDEYENAVEIIDEFAQKRAT